MFLNTDVALQLTDEQIQAFSFPDIEAKLQSNCSNLHRFNKMPFLDESIILEG